MIRVLNHHAMGTLFQVRIDSDEAAYADQAARAAFDIADRLEALLSRFRPESEISQAARLAPGETLRLCESVFACLSLAREMETATRGAFSITASCPPAETPRWSLDAATMALRCEQGRLAFDLGAIGKGWALDVMAEELAEWECPAYLLIAGGSSVLAGDPPSGHTGWDCGLGDDGAPFRRRLSHVSLSGSGVATKGRHIIDPRTGLPATVRERAWALASSAAVSDALSTACMVLEAAVIAEILTGRADWLALINEGTEWRCHGGRALPD